MTLRRGFKAMAERMAVEVRAELDLAPAAGVDPRRIAALRGITVVSASDLIDVARLEELEQIQSYAFSAATFELPTGRNVIVTNPLRDPARTNSDLAHELAHVLLQHNLTEVEHFGGRAFRTCAPDQEEEATALGGALLLPRPLLLAAARRGLTVEEVARQYQVTQQMARYRMNTTGVTRQAGQTRRQPTVQPTS